MEFMSEGFGLSISFPVYALIHLVPFAGFTRSLSDDETYCYLACRLVGVGML